MLNKNKETSKQIVYCMLSSGPILRRRQFCNRQKGPGQKGPGKPIFSAEVIEKHGKTTKNS